MNSAFSEEENEFLNEIVADVVGMFLDEFGRQVRPMLPDDARSSLSISEPGSIETFSSNVPVTIDEYRQYTWKFIENNLPSYYDPTDPFIEELVRKAAEKAKEATVEYELEPEITPKLVLMALYDFVILCDDSSSMKQENRIETLEDTCQRIAKIATLLQPGGISLRFLNDANDHQYDNLVKEEDISKKVRGVRYSGMTKLGTVLHKKVVKPLIIDKAVRKDLKAPVITIIITDGCPTVEKRNCFQETVSKCKDDLTANGLEPASAVFVISRVGNDIDAEAFLTGIRNDQSLNEMVYCCADQLDREREVFQKVGNDKKYSGYLIKLFAEALDSQTRTY